MFFEKVYEKLSKSHKLINKWKKKSSKRNKNAEKQVKIEKFDKSCFFPCIFRQKVQDLTKTIVEES